MASDAEGFVWQSGKAFHSYFSLTLNATTVRAVAEAAERRFHEANLRKGVVETRDGKFLQSRKDDLIHGVGSSLDSNAPLPSQSTQLHQPSFQCRSEAFALS